MLGSRLSRIPDGETGARRSWIGWQQVVVRGNPFLAPDESQRSPTSGIALMGLAPGVKPSEVTFGELGYAHEARASYQLFLQARKAGDIPKGVRFQVCLPTPLAVACSNFSRTNFRDIEKAYEKAMLAEVDALCAAIPHKQLAIQWDVCHDMIMWDRQLAEFVPPSFADLEGEIISRIKRLCARVPRDVECGIHLCYGDNKAKHFVEPRDAEKLVSFANAIAKAVARPISYVHMPVPIARNDDAYFRPFENLKLKNGTGLYLGVIHADGKAKIDERIAAAKRYVPHFGIATECGIARARQPGRVRTLLNAHKHTLPTRTKERA
jgi:methionine synthase II (cobalamin-independent)